MGERGMGQNNGKCKGKGKGGNGKSSETWTAKLDGTGKLHPREGKLDLAGRQLYLLREAGAPEGRLHGVEKGVRHLRGDGAFVVNMLAQRRRCAKDSIGATDECCGG